MGIGAREINTTNGPTFSLESGWFELGTILQTFTLFILLFKAVPLIYKNWLSAQQSRLELHFNKLCIIASGKLWEGKHSEIVHKRSVERLIGLKEVFSETKIKIANDDNSILKAGDVVVGGLLMALIKILLLPWAAIYYLQHSQAQHTVFLCKTKSGGWFAIREIELYDATPNLVPVNEDWAKKFLAHDKALFVRHFGEPEIA